jgi:hypothetical protein
MILSSVNFPFESSPELALASFISGEVAAVGDDEIVGDGAEGADGEGCWVQLKSRQQHTIQHAKNSFICVTSGGRVLEFEERGALYHQRRVRHNWFLGHWFLGQASKSKGGEQAHLVSSCIKNVEVLRPTQT